MAMVTKGASKKADPLSKTKKTHAAKTAAAMPKTGAPATTQGSRKGKRAWRKNVDIGDVEMGLDEMRAEERVVGYVELHGSDLRELTGFD